MLLRTIFKLNVNLLGNVNLNNRKSSTIATTTIIAISLFSVATLLSLQGNILANAQNGAAAGNMSKAGGAAAGNMSKAGGAAGNTSAKVLTNASKVVGSGLKGLGNAIGAGLKGLGNLISPGKK